MLLAWGCSDAASEMNGGAAGQGGADDAGQGGAGDAGQGGAGEAGTGSACEAETLECKDCPTLEDFRESCADASPTACGGAIVGPLGVPPFSYTYCYAADGALIGKITEDSDAPSSRRVEGSDCTANGPSEPLCDDGPRSIVSAASEAIEIGWFNYFTGGYRFKRRIDQLSTEQRELAEAIRIAPPTGDCWEDATHLSIMVTDSDTEHEFEANEFTGTCGRDVTLVDFEAATALLDTVDCLSAKGYDAESPETAPSITANDGCFHGLFNASGRNPEWWFRAEVPSAGEYDFVIDACGDRGIELELFEEDAATSLASSSPTSECPTLTHAFTSAGSYALRVRMVDGSAAGDFYLALESSASE